MFIIQAILFFFGINLQLMVISSSLLNKIKMVIKSVKLFHFKFKKKIMVIIYFLNKLLNFTNKYGSSIKIKKQISEYIIFKTKTKQKKKIKIQ